MKQLPIAVAFFEIEINLQRLYLGYNLFYFIINADIFIIILISMLNQVIFYSFDETGNKI